MTAAWRPRTTANRSNAGFTLVELLTVIAIIALLIAVLAPALASARRTARAVACRANLAGLMTAIHMYATENADLVVPSYNMRGVTTGTSNPLDGWGPILDRDHFTFGSRELRGNPMVCPDTVDIAGMAATQTGTSPDNPRGWMEWPAILTISQDYSTTIPQYGFDRVLKVAYWMNADNLIGVPRPIYQGIHFSGSVGYGPDPSGKSMRACKLSDAKYPSRFIALADGLYAGQQTVTRLGNPNCRIGYRHDGGVPTANAAFADGHVAPIRGDAFPRRLMDGSPPETVRDENMSPNPTVYSDPEKYLLP